MMLTHCGNNVRNRYSGCVFSVKDIVPVPLKTSRNLVGLRWFLLIMPIIVLFFEENGLSLTDIMVLQAVFSIAVIVLEVPSGYYADVIGRRNSLVFGATLAFFGFVTYALAHGFWTFQAAELILGLGTSFISGTDSALLYDSLLEMNREGDYQKMEGRMQSVGNISEGVAGILGGLLATMTLRTPFYVEAVVVFFAIPLALSLTEPSRKRFKSSRGNITGILEIVRYALHDNREIKWLILYSAFVSVSTLTMVWLVQPYLKMVELPLSFFGIVWAILNFSVGIFSLLAYRVEALLGRRRTLISLIFLVLVGYLLLAFFRSLWAMPIFLIFYYVRGINRPVVRNYLNRLVTSDKRATVLSVANMMGRVAFSIVGPFVGWTADIYSLQQSFIVAGTVFFGAGLVSLISLHRIKAL